MFSRPRSDWKGGYWHCAETRFARTRRPVGHDRGSGTENVDAGILQTPDIEITKITLGDMVGGIAIFMVRIIQVAYEIGSEPAHLAAQRRKVFGPGAQVIDVDVPEVDKLGPACLMSRKPLKSAMNW